jgi:hypothetical protein
MRPLLRFLKPEKIAPIYYQMPGDDKNQFAFLIWTVPIKMIFDNPRGL